MLATLDKLIVGHLVKEIFPNFFFWNLVMQLFTSFCYFPSYRSKYSPLPSVFQHTPLIAMLQVV